MFSSLPNTLPRLRSVGLNQSFFTPQTIRSSPTIVGGPQRLSVGRPLFRKFVVGTQSWVRADEFASWVERGFWQDLDWPWLDDDFTAERGVVVMQVP